MVQVVLEAGKTVDILTPSIKNWGTISVIVKFVELDESREYSFESNDLKAYLNANPSKTWKDFAKERLLPLYNRLALAKQLKDGLT